jgi:hypothetical protein
MQVLQQNLQMYTSLKEMYVSSALPNLCDGPQDGSL